MAAFSRELARVLSKRGFCSRGEARELVRTGQVRVNGRVVCDPDRVVKPDAVIEVDAKPVRVSAKAYVMLNKPRGLLTTTSDEQGRETVYRCFENATLPKLVPVGRLDKASEGLLLFTNDNDWAADITNPESKVTKTYHVQINRVADVELIERMTRNEQFRLCASKILRTGERNSWLEMVLDEGKNRHIRRLLDALGIEVLRLIRIRIGCLELGGLPKGQWRHLEPHERGQALTLTRD